VILSPHEVAYVVLQYWKDPEDAPNRRIAVALVYAESAGETEQISRSTSGASIGNRDHGLFQISGRWHGDKLAAAAASGRDWRNPFVNAEIAYTIYRSSNRTFQPWAAFTNGSYQTFLPDADIALTNPVPLYQAK